MKIYFDITWIFIFEAFQQPYLVALTLFGLGLAFHLKVKRLLNWTWLVFLDVYKRLIFQ